MEHTFPRQLLREKIEDMQVLTEDVNGDKQYYIKGVFMQADIKNRNGRIYPDEIMLPEANRYIKEAVEKNRAYGELGHPNHPNIDLNRVSHLIKELVKEGSNYIGKAIVLDTPCGNVAKGILKAGGAIGASTRAVGSLKEDKDKGAMVVQNDFRLATAGDIVSDPSAPDAWMSAIVENKEWVQVNGIWTEQVVESIRKEVLGSKQHQLNEKIDGLWKRYMDAVTK